MRGQPADKAERGLHAGDVHHGQRRAVGADTATHRQGLQTCAAEQAHGVGRTDHAAQRRVDEDRLRVEQHEAVGALVGLRHRGRRDGGGHQGVDAEHLHGDTPAIGVGHDGVDFDDGTRQRHLRVRGDSRVDGLVEAGALRAQFEVGLAIDLAHRGAELAERRLIDQVHRECQRHAEHHRQPGRDVARGVVAQLGPRDLAQQRQQGQPLQCSHCVLQLLRRSSRRDA